MPKPILPSIANFNPGIAPLDDGIRMLDQGIIDALATDENSFFYRLCLLKKNRTDYQIAGKITAPEPIYICFSPSSKDSQHYADIWDQGIRQFRKTKEYQNLLAKYAISEEH